MLSFYFNLNKVLKRKIKDEGKPDIIVASSVHPLTILRGIRIGKKYKIPVVCEIRDLWPESLVSFGILNSSSTLVKLFILWRKIFVFQSTRHSFYYERW